MKNAVDHVDAAIVQLLVAVREWTQREAAGVGRPPVRETSALLGATSDLRRAAMAHECDACLGCELVRRADDRELATLLLWNAFRELQLQAHSTRERTRLTVEQLAAQLLLEDAHQPSSRIGLH